jgi:hypothetical protein
VFAEMASLLYQTLVAFKAIVLLIHSAANVKKIYFFVFNARLPNLE